MPALNKKALCVTALLFVGSLQIPEIALAKPVQATSREEALGNAPIILLAESGAREFDDLKEGEIIQYHTIKFEGRKQSFKILKVYRNKTDNDLKVGSSIQLYNKSNGCLDFLITIERKGNKLEIKSIDGHNQVNHQVDITNSKEKVVLFLQPNYSDPKILEHYGWFVSPEPFTAGLESQISKAAYAGPKRGVHMTSACE